MKKNSLRFTLPLVVTLIMLSLNTSAQLFTRPLPKSWTAKADGIERKTWFHLPGLKPSTKSKDRIFQDKIHTTDYPHLFYSIAGVNDLIAKLDKIAVSFNSINVYITLPTKPVTCATALPPISNDQIILVFAPADRVGETVKDVGNYFIIGPDDKCYEIEKSCMQEWSSNYFKKVIDGADGLISTILNIKENKYKGVLTDTRSIAYPYSNIKEFLVNEKDYQGRKFNKVSGIQVDFAQFTDRGDPQSDKVEYQYRLILQFEFTRKNEQSKDEVFYIDDQKNFLRRLKKTKKEEEKNRASNDGRIRIKTFNHGSLCPQVCD